MSASNMESFFRRCVLLEPKAEEETDDDEEAIQAFMSAGY
jgi:hypothetical protein